MSFCISYTFAWWHVPLAFVATYAVGALLILLLMSGGMRLMR